MDLEKGMCAKPVDLGEIERRAQQGESEAQITLAQGCEARGETRLARGWYANAAKRGSVVALRSLAINLLTQVPIVVVDGVNMIRSAADKGDAEAAYVCGMLAAQDYPLEGRWKIARQCLKIAADRGWAPAREQLTFLGAQFPVDGAEAPPLAASVKALSRSPRIEAIEGFATPEVCGWLIARARPRLDRATVYDSSTGGLRVEDARSNSSVAFNIAQSDIVLMQLRERIAATVGVAPGALEASAVLHYTPGQEFLPHFDFLDPAVPAYAKELAERGQRVATFLLYLNDDYDGGETDFPRLGFKHKGKKGDALVFWNLTDEGKPDEQTQHAGLPTTSGEKWLLSQWLRQRAC